jgi:hypothetical protein
MTNILGPCKRFAIVGAAALLLQVSATAQNNLLQSPLTLSEDGQTIHILPTVNDASAFAQPNADTGPLIYHAGGAVMNPSVTTYAIFWVPAKLQNGASTGMSTHYRSVQTTMLADYAGHGIGNINTQYYQTVGGATSYIQNKGGFGAAYLDTAAYPSSGCTDHATPGNCLTDAQLRAEIQKVMQTAHLTGGLNKIFVLFTSSGEGSCFDAHSTSCAYTQYCAYHGSFKIGTTPVIYANEPYGNLSTCQIQGAPSPTNDPVADAAASIASHELTEAITDPLLNAWFTAQGNEIGDLCAYNYGHAGWDSGKANQMWNGHFYLLQQEYNNHTRSCVQVGP